MDNLVSFSLEGIPLTKIMPNPSTAANVRGLLAVSRTRLARRGWVPAVRPTMRVITANIHTLNFFCRLLYRMPATRIVPSGRTRAVSSYTRFGAASRSESCVGGRCQQYKSARRFRVLMLGAWRITVGGELELQVSSASQSSHKPI